MHTISVRYIGPKLAGEQSAERFTFSDHATLRTLFDEIRLRHGAPFAERMFTCGNTLLDSVVLLVDGVYSRNLETPLPGGAEVTIMALPPMIGG